MYAVVLSLEAQPQLRAIDRAHGYVLQKLIAALRPLCPGIACAGTSDLVIGDRKFSGNSLRIKQRDLLYHGTILYNFPLAWTADLLKTPARQPAYREGRRPSGFSGESTSRRRGDPQGPDRRLECQHAGHELAARSRGATRDGPLWPVRMDRGILMARARNLC